MAGILKNGIKWSGWKSKPFTLLLGIWQVGRTKDQRNI